MEKKIIDGVYTITGITSTSQVREFYKEVVAQNIEKYVAITTQNIKFKFNPVSDSAVMLTNDEQFAINPSYRKIEVEPLEELVEKAQEQETVKEDVSNEVETTEDNAESVAVVDEYTSDVEHEDVADEPKEEIVSDNTLIETLTADNEKLNVLIQDLEEKIKLAEERAVEAENQTQFTQKHCKDLEDELASAKANIDAQNEEIKSLNAQLSASEVPSEPEPLTVDNLFEYAAILGYKIYLTK